MNELKQLLFVQDHDINADQLRYKRERLPERDQLDHHNQQLTELTARVEVRQAERDKLEREQKRLEDEVASLVARMAEVDRTLYSGTISAPRELKALQDELASLRRRQRMLEDDQIELMEVIEPIQAELAQIDTESEDLLQESTRLGEALSRAEGEIDHELDTLGEQRSESVAGVSAELLEEYERLRHRGAGVGIARLVGSNCGGCHLSLAAVEIDRIRKAAPDDLVHCEECGRILVR